MKIAIRSLFTFYSSFCVFSLLIDIFCLAIIVRTNFNLFPLMFWFRAVVMAIIFYFINDYKTKEFYYYQNLGVSKNFLWTATFSLDTILFLSANLIFYVV